MYLTSLLWLTSVSRRFGRLLGPLPGDWWRLRRLAWALLCVGLLLFPSLGSGFGGQDRLELAQVALTGIPPAQSVPRPEALSRLLWEVLCPVIILIISIPGQK